MTERLRPRACHLVPVARFNAEHGIVGVFWAIANATIPAHWLDHERRVKYLLCHYLALRSSILWASRLLTGWVVDLCWIFLLWVKIWCMLISWRLCCIRWCKYSADFREKFAEHASILRARISLTVIASIYGRKAFYWSSIDCLFFTWVFYVLDHGWITHSWLWTLRLQISFGSLHYDFFLILPVLLRS